MFPPVVIPSSTSWKRGSFPEMKLAYQLPPCLEKATPAMISGARPGVGNESTWGLSAKTAAGLDIVLVELGKDAKHDRASWLKDFKEGATKGEVMVDADDAVVKRSRVMGRKTAADLPYLSDDSIDLRVCKKLGESDYCLELVGTVTLALNKPGVTIDEGTELVAWVRSLERAPVK